MIYAIIRDRSNPLSPSRLPPTQRDPDDPANSPEQLAQALLPVAADKLRQALKEKHECADLFGGIGGIALLEGMLDNAFGSIVFKDLTGDATCGYADGKTGVREDDRRHGGIKIQAR